MCVPVLVPVLYWRSDLGVARGSSGWGSESEIGKPERLMEGKGKGICG
jgi:hypothetical protein